MFRFFCVVCNTVKRTHGKVEVTPSDTPSKRLGKCRWHTVGRQVAKVKK